MIYASYFGQQDTEDYARGIAVNSTNQAHITGAIRDLEDTQTFVAEFEGGGENVIWQHEFDMAGADSPRLWPIGRTNPRYALRS